jgi:MFS family permease
LTTPDGAGTATIVGIALSASLVPLNSTMIAVALPEIADDLDVSRGSTGVLVIVYLVTMLLGQPSAGWIGDRIGPRRMVMIGLSGLGLASLGAAFVTSFPALVAARTIQGAFAATLVPSIQAMLRSVSLPDQRGRNFGLLSSVFGGGAAIGPLVGGLVITLAGWQAVFLVNIPIVVLLLIAIARVAPGRVSPDPAAETSATSSGRILNRSFTAAFASNAGTTFAQYVLLLVVPLVLDDRGWGSAEIGLALTGLTLGMVILGPIGGRVGDRRGRRTPATIGLSISAGAMIVLAVAGPSIHAALLIITIAAFGIGFGFAGPSLMTAALESVPETRTATAGGVFQTSRYTGSIPASLLFALLVDEGTGGVGIVFTLAAVTATVAIATAVLLPDP